MRAHARHPISLLHVAQRAANWLILRADMYRQYVRAAAISFITFSHVLAVGNDTVKPVYFSLIISGGENGFKSSGGIPSIDIALEKIIELQILPGYNLTYENIRNSKVRGILYKFRRHNKLIKKCVFWQNLLRTILCYCIIYSA